MSSNSHTCFTLKQDTPLITGIMLDRSQRGLQLSLGGKYILLQRKCQCSTINIDGNPWVIDAKLTIDTNKYGKSFPILEKAKVNNSKLLLVNFCKKLEQDEQVYQGATGTVDIIKGSGKSLATFNEPGQYLEVMFGDGSVVTITFDGDNLKRVVNGHAEAVFTRIEAAKETLGDDININVRTATIYGLINLIKLQNDRNDRNTIVDFLEDQKMSVAHERTLMSTLRNMGDNRYLEFVDNDHHTDNVTILKPRRGHNADAHGRKAAKAERDREIRNKMKGKSSGGKK